MSAKTAENLLAKAQARVSDLTRQLDEALSAGGSTADIRDRLELARAEVRRIEGEARGEHAATEREQATVTEAQAAELVREAEAALLAEVDSLLTLPEPDFALDKAVALKRVWAAEQLGKAEREREAHRQRLQALRERRDALERNRRAIVERRASGDQRDGDGRELELLRADIEGVSDLLRRTEQEQSPVEPRMQDLVFWRDSWENHVKEVRARALRSLASELETALIDCAERLRELAPVGSAGFRYVPAPRLREAARFGIY